MLIEVNREMVITLCGHLLIDSNAITDVEMRFILVNQCSANTVIGSVGFGKGKIGKFAKGKKRGNC